MAKNLSKNIKVRYYYLDSTGQTQEAFEKLSEIDPSRKSSIQKMIIYPMVDNKGNIEPDVKLNPKDLEGFTGLTALVCHAQIKNISPAIRRTGCAENLLYVSQYEYTDVYNAAATKDDYTISFGSNMGFTLYDANAEMPSALARSEVKKVGDISLVKNVALKPRPIRVRNTPVTPNTSITDAEFVTIIDCLTNIDNFIVNLGIQDKSDLVTPEMINDIKQLIQDKALHLEDSFVSKLQELRKDFESQVTIAQTGSEEAKRKLMSEIQEKVVTFYNDVVKTHNEAMTELIIESCVSKDDFNAFADLAIEYFIAQDATMEDLGEHFADFKEKVLEKLDKSSEVYARIEKHFDTLATAEGQQTIIDSLNKVYKNMVSREDLEREMSKMHMENSQGFSELKESFIEQLGTNSQAIINAGINIDLLAQRVMDATDGLSNNTESIKLLANEVRNLPEGLRAEIETAITGAIQAVKKEKNAQIMQLKENNRKFVEGMTNKIIEKFKGLPDKTEFNTLKSSINANHEEVIALVKSVDERTQTGLTGLDKKIDDVSSKIVESSLTSEKFEEILKNTPAFKNLIETINKIPDQEKQLQMFALIKGLSEQIREEICDKICKKIDKTADRTHALVNNKTSEIQGSIGGTNSLIRDTANEVKEAITLHDELILNTVSDIENTVKKVFESPDFQNKINNLQSNLSAKIDDKTSDLKGFIYNETESVLKSVDNGVDRVIIAIEGLPNRVVDQTMQRLTPMIDDIMDELRRIDSNLIFDRRAIIDTLSNQIHNVGTTILNNQALLTGFATNVLLSTLGNAMGGHAKDIIDSVTSNANSINQNINDKFNVILNILNTRDAQQATMLRRIITSHAFINRSINGIQATLTSLANTINSGFTQINNKLDQTRIAILTSNNNQTFINLINNIRSHAEHDVVNGVTFNRGDVVHIINSYRDINAIVNELGITKDGLVNYLYNQYNDAYTIYLGKMPKRQQAQTPQPQPAQTQPITINVGGNNIDISQALGLYLQGLASGQVNNSTNIDLSALANIINSNVNTNTNVNTVMPGYGAWPMMANPMMYMMMPMMAMMPMMIMPMMMFGGFGTAVNGNTNFNPNAYVQILQQIIGIIQGAQTGTPPASPTPGTPPASPTPGTPPASPQRIKVLKRGVGWARMLSEPKRTPWQAIKAFAKRRPLVAIAAGVVLGGGVAVLGSAIAAAGGIAGIGAAITSAAEYMGWVGTAGAVAGATAVGVPSTIGYFRSGKKERSYFRFKFNYDLCKKHEKNIEKYNNLAQKERQALSDLTANGASSKQRLRVLKNIRKYEKSRNKFIGKFEYRASRALMRKSELNSAEVTSNEIMAMDVKKINEIKQEMDNLRNELANLTPGTMQYTAKEDEIKSLECDLELMGWDGVSEDYRTFDTEAVELIDHARKYGRQLRGTVNNTRVDTMAEIRARNKCDIVKEEEKLTDAKITAMADAKEQQALAANLNFDRNAYIQSMRQKKQVQQVQKANWDNLSPEEKAEIEKHSRYSDGPTQTL